MTRIATGWLAACIGLAASVGFSTPSRAADAGAPDAVALRAHDAMVAAVPPESRKPDSGPSSALPLDHFLDADGRLSLPPGFSGSLDPSGFALVSKPGEAPRFAAKNAIDEAARWDPQFGQAIGCDGQVRALLALPDGKLVLGGSFTFCGNVSTRRVAIWDPVAGRFSALGSEASNGTNSDVLALAHEGGRIYIGGFFTQAGGLAATRVARFDIATQTWSSLGSGTANGVTCTTPPCVRALAIDGRFLYAGGNFTQAGGVVASRIARFDIDAGVWSTLGSPGAEGVDDDVHALSSLSGSMYVGGEFAVAGGVPASRVARFDTASGIWSPLGAGVAGGSGGTVLAIAATAAGIYVGGLFTEAGGAAASRVARFDALGGGWSPLGGGVDGSVRALSVSGDVVYAGGFFTVAGGVSANRIARYSAGSQSWSSLGTGAANGVDNGVAAIADLGTDLYVGGQFARAGDDPGNRVARFNETTLEWSPLGAGVANAVSGPVYALAVSGENLFVGGVFTRAGNVEANNVARFDTSTATWHSLGTGTANGTGEGVLGIGVSGNDVYVAGLFGTAGGLPASAVARFNLISQSWSTLGPPSSNGVLGTAYALAIGGGSIYVGGVFVEAAGVQANYIARFDTATQAWSSLGSGAANGVNGAVNAIAVSGGLVVVGGEFTLAGGAAANRIARYDTAGGAWAPLGTGAQNGVNGVVNAIAVRDTNVYVGGDFSAAGAAPANLVARFDTVSQSWLSLGIGAANGLGGCTSFCIFAFAFDDDDVYVGGFFTSAGGNFARSIARFDTTSASWFPLAGGSLPGIRGDVLALAPIGRSVYIAGGFTQAGPVTSLNVARYDIRRSTTASVAASGGPGVTVNTPIVFTGTIATAGFPAQPGAVAFLDNGAPINACAAQGLVGGFDTRTAVCSTIALAVGTHAVVARYIGDSVNFIGTSDPVTIDVVPPSFNHNLSTLPGATFNGAGYSSGTISVSLAGGTGVVAPVAFTVVNAALLPPGLTAAPQPNGLLVIGTPTQAGSFTFTVRATDSSSTTVGGPFSNDRQYTIVVARAAQTIGAITRVDAVPLDNGVAFADGDFAVQASATSGLPVVIDSTTPTVCQVGPPGFTVQPLQIGTCTLRARQAGNANYEPAIDVLRTFQVKATPTVDVASSPNPTVWPVGGAQEPAVLTATVETPGGATPTGSVRFQRAGNTIAGCAAQPLSGSGSVATATCSTTALARGANAITAAYAGDALNVAVSSNIHSHQLNVGTATGIAMITPSPCVVGEACTVGVAVAAGNGTAPGSVQVASSTGGSCTVTLVAGGGSCALTATTAGSGTVSATYLGSPPWLASPPTTQSHPFVATVDELFGNGFEPATAVSR